jgi:hypothetical protein
MSKKYRIKVSWSAEAQVKEFVFWEEVATCFEVKEHDAINSAHRTRNGVIQRSAISMSDFRLAEPVTPAFLAQRVAEACFTRIIDNGPSEQFPGLARGSC